MLAGVEMLQVCKIGCRYLPKIPSASAVALRLDTHQRRNHAAGPSEPREDKVLFWTQGLIFTPDIVKDFVVLSEKSPVKRCTLEGSQIITLRSFHWDLGSLGPSKGFLGVEPRTGYYGKGTLWNPDAFLKVYLSPGFSE